MISISRLVLVLCDGIFASAAVADNRVRFHCVDGQEFTISFLPAHDTQLARLVFAGSGQTIIPKNQLMARPILCGRRLRIPRMAGQDHLGGHAIHPAERNRLLAELEFIHRPR
jgi:hypothetical protein